MAQIVDLRKKTVKAGVVLKKEAPLTRPDKVQNTEEKNPTVIAEKFSNSAKRIEWEAPSFYYNPQKKYLALIVTLLLCGAGVMLFYRIDTLGAILLILSSFMLILYANKKPAVSKVVVNQAGVMTDDQAYYYKELKSFWLDYGPNGPKELSLEAKKWYRPYVKISIENQNPVEIRALMIKFIPEKEHQRSLVDFISRKVGL